jgi:hypothetical protein
MVEFSGVKADSTAFMLYITLLKVKLRLKGSVGSKLGRQISVLFIAANYVEENCFFEG